jgi:PPOX class probable F420-dependent enzyme
MHLISNAWAGIRSRADRAMTLYRTPGLRQPERPGWRERIFKELHMPKRRDLIRMTEEEGWKFIETQKTVQVATVGKDGTPHVMPLWFAIDDGKIVLETFTKSQKVVNLVRNDRISVLFEDGEEYNQLRGISIQGRARLIQEHDEVHRLHLAVLVRNQPNVPVDVLEKATASMVSKKTAIVIEPDRMISWDHGKLDVAY